MNTKRLLREKQVHEEYGLTLAWLRKMRLFRKGPPFVKLNRSVFYRREDVDTWIDAHRVETKITTSARR